jgi:hypothetical protein
MLTQTAAIFRGTLKDVKFTYDNCGGPRTNYVFSDASSLAGAVVPADVTLSVLGGPTPNGTWVNVSEIPKLALQSEYVGFLRNTDWTYSPIVSNLVFRREMAGGRETLIDPTGRAVTGWGSDGPTLSAEAVSDMVGAQVRGYRGNEPPAQGQGDTSENADPLANPAPPRPRGPTMEQIARAGLFARPSLRADVLGNQQTASVEGFVSAVRGMAEREHVNIGGRLTLNPYWKCWGTTPTTRFAR